MLPRVISSVLSERDTTEGEGMRIRTNITAALVAVILTTLVGLSACGGTKDDPGGGGSG
jgi:hypothetical protein